MIPAWIVEYASLLLRGLQTTLAILVIASVFGFVLAVLVALARISKNKVIAKVSLFYTSVTRGTPLLIQIYIFYYGLGSLFAQFPLIRGSFLWPYLRDGYWYIVFALVVSVGAYVGEVIRGGLLAVPKGEMVAASASSCCSPVSSAPPRPCRRRSSTPCCSGPSGWRAGSGAR